VADLALSHHLVERAGGVLERRVGIGPVHLVEVDVVGAEVAQGRLDAPAQRLRARVALQAVVGQQEAALGGDHHLVAAGLQLGLQRLAEDLLRLPEAVGLRGVEEVDPELDGPAHGALRVLDLGLAPVPADLPGAEADARYLEACPTQPDVLHGVLLRLECGRPRPYPPPAPPHPGGLSAEGR